LEGLPRPPAKKTAYAATFSGDSELVSLRTERVPAGGLRFAGAHVEGEHGIRLGDGSLVHVLNPPQARSWGVHGELLDAQPAEWSLTEDGGDAVLSAKGEPDVDLLELRPEAAHAFATDRSEPLTVVPPFKALASPRDLGEYLVGGRVLTGTETRKKPVDSTALSLYRIARFRGGPLWVGVAEHVAAVTADRIESAPDTGPVHDIWSGEETHVRYLNDAILLMAAHAEWAPGDRWELAAARACDLLDGFTVDAAGGSWVLHDSLERDAGRNDFVLNTHVQAIVALLGAGRDTSAHVAAAVEALSHRVPRRAGLRAAAGLAVVETARARGPRRFVRRRVGPAYTRAAEVCTRAGAFRLPGGWIARDLSGKRGPGRYLSVNLGDMAALALSLDTTPPGLETWLADGLRFAQRSGFFRAELRDRAPMAALIPAVFRLAQRHSDAAAAAAMARAAGLAPMIGWPGYEDRLWARLGAGSPL
jgi:hypothetical protein